jgi:cation:H+ antiporter
MSYSLREPCRDRVRGVFFGGHGPRSTPRVHWVLFAVSGVVIVLAGARIARYGDDIARMTGIGAAFVGAIMVAAATSLPELATASIAVAQGSVRLALGNLFGTLTINMALLGVAVLVFRKADVLGSVGAASAVSAAIAVALCGIAAIGAFVGGATAPLGLGWASVAIAVAYVGGVRIQRRSARKAERGEQADPGSLRKLGLSFAVASVVLVPAAYVLVIAARGIAEQLGVSESFVGAAFVALTTSLPESTVAFAAFRREAYAIGVGALMGSNAFDVLIVVPLDLLDGPAPILAETDESARVSMLFAILLMSLVVVGILDRGDRRIRGVDPLAVGIVVAFAVGLYLAYRAAI